MASRVLYSLVWVSCVILLPTIWADNCRGHGVTAEIEELQCGSQYCCGDGDRIYCCDEWGKSLTPYKEGRIERLSRRVTPWPIIIGSIIVLAFIVIVTIIICCLCPCCLMYKRCRKRRNGMQPTVIVTPGVNAPQLPLTPYGHQLSYPGYQPIPVQHGSAMPTAPPSYLEATDPARSPVVTYPIPPPGQNYLPPPQSDEFVQLPFNPSYGPNP